METPFFFCRKMPSKTSKTMVSNGYFCTKSPFLGFFYLKNYKVVIEYFLKASKNSFGRIYLYE